MDRRQFLIAGTALSGVTSAESAEAPTPALTERVDFSYAFAPPHRLTLSRPEASEKTILDVEPAHFTMLWSNGDLRATPLATFKTPRIEWRIKVQPRINGRTFTSATWKRGGQFLPMLDNEYRDGEVTLRLSLIGADGAALTRITVYNASAEPRKVGIACEVLGGWVAHNAAWMDTGRDPDALLACQSDRPDRVLLVAIGGSAYPVDAPKVMTLEWTLEPGERREGWLIRPHEAYQAELPALRRENWQARFDAAQSEWHTLLARAVRVEIPDEAVRDAFYACLADIFVMREPLKDGYLGTTCGTEVYRATNPAEPSLAAIALDQLGYHAEAANGLRVHLDMQESDGNWNDSRGWGHHMWGLAGFKAWAATEHYRLTGDRAYLGRVYPRMAASSRWMVSARTSTRSAGARDERGLMPRGMGDGGLMNGSDYFGVFYAHNIFSLFADRLAAEAAVELGKTGEAAELRKIYDDGLAALRTSLATGAIQEEGYRWIPNTPGKRDGSRWGMLYALFPAFLLAPDDPLVTGSLKHIERSISPGGQPIHTGWMPDGAWVAITVDNVAENHLVLGNGDAAVRYLYSSLNHATPLYTWCEERGLEPGAKKTAGDRQHLWTPVAIVRFLRDALVMEEGGTLHLARGAARSWLAAGKPVGVAQAPTHFGAVSYRIESVDGAKSLRATVVPPSRRAPKEIVLHLRHPERARLRSVTVNGRAAASFDREREFVRLGTNPSTMSVVAAYE